MNPQSPDPAAYSKWWLPIDISAHGPAVDDLILWLHVFMAVLFIGWGIFFIYCLWRFSAKNNPKASYVPVGGGISKAIELVVVVIEAALLVFLSMPVWARVKNERPTEDKAVVVRIFARQFEWSFQYPGPDGQFGNLDLKYMDPDAGNPLGLDRSGAGKDDIITSNKLIVPNDKPIIGYLTSRDVIHSFKVPVLRFTQDANPGMVIPIWFQIHDDKVAGVYDIQCAQLCGVQHTNMRALMQVVTAADFAEFGKNPGKWQSEHPVTTAVKQRE